MGRRAAMNTDMAAADFARAEVLAWAEKTLQARIVAAAVGTRDRPSPLGWRAYHSYFSDRSEAGWPDLVLYRDRIIFAELKATTGKLTAKQRDTLDALKEAGGEVYVWRPADWLDGSILEILR